MNVFNATRHNASRTRFAFGELRSGEFFTFKKSPLIWMRLQDVPLRNRAVNQHGMVKYFNTCDDVERRADVGWVVDEQTQF